MAHQFCTRKSSGTLESGMIVVIDNYDSFTYNLVQMLQVLEHDVKVLKSDLENKNWIRASAQQIKAFLISPGPGHPCDAELSRWVVEQYHPSHPILGVCLGHQVIAEVFGGKVIQASQPMHGKLSRIYHQQQGSFREIKNAFQVVRYHSLIVEKESLPECLEAHAHTEEGIIMGLKHRTFPVEGWQFHPESILSEQGESLLRNFFTS